MNKTHAKRSADEDSGPLCNAKVTNPEYSDTPTCLRCRGIKERESRAKFMHGFRPDFVIIDDPVKDDSKRASFATVSGPRTNPRNRHTSSNPHVFYTTPIAEHRSTVTVTATKNETKRTLSRRQQYDAVSKRLNRQT